MKIPKQVKVGGIWYKVKMVKGLKEQISADGEYSPIENTISIDSEISKEAQVVTFIHEILHACNSTMNHEFLDSLAEQLYQVFHDNHLIK